METCAMQRKMLRGASVKVGAKALCSGATRGDRNRDVGLCETWAEAFVRGKRGPMEALPNMWARATRPAFLGELCEFDKMRVWERKRG